MKLSGASALVTDVMAVIFMAATAVFPATAQTPATLLTTVNAGNTPVAVAANSATNKIYAVNQNSNNMTVIDGATYSATTVPTGQYPDAVAVNPATNMIYVANYNSHSVTVVNGATNQVSATVQAGFGPKAVAVNTVTNKIYVADYCANAYCTLSGSQCAVTVIDGATNLPTNVTVSTQQGCHPDAVAVNTATNKIYVADWGSNDVAIIDGNSNSLLATVSLAPYGAYPQAIAIDPTTKQTFVALYGANSTCNPSLGASNLVDIDGTTNSVNASVPVGICPTSIAVNPASGQVYVANQSDGSGDGKGTVTIINESTLTPTTLAVGDSPIAIDVDLGTNKAYVANAYPDPNLGNTVTVIDGYTASALPLPLGGNSLYPKAIVVNPVSNGAYVADSGYNSVSVIGGASSDPLQFVPVTPCRVADTRQQQNGYLPGGMARSFAVPQSNCNIPATAIAYALNVTVVPVQGHPLGYLTVWPSGEPQPLVSLLNSTDGRIKANAAILPAGGAGAVSVYATDSTDVILDINGYFQPPDPSIPTLQFYPLTPCRVVDTRPGNQNYPGLGPPALAAQAARELPILNASPCFRQVPPGVVPAAYSFNVTVVPNPPGQSLGYVTLWPSDQHQPVVSTLNNLKATVVANAAIVPAARTGDVGNVDVYASNSTDLILDVNGYFAAPGPGGLSLYPSVPCRALDTRHNGGAFNGLRNPPANIAASPCGIPASAQGYVLNATVVPLATLGYLSLWADPGSPPLVSTLNAVDGSLTSNMAIVGNQDGSIDAYAAAGPTQLILDISSYFAP